jgi:hypothetical protein
MADVLRFWVARGADGFRIDALRQTIKDDRWRDNPPNPAWREGEDPYRDPGSARARSTAPKANSMCARRSPGSSAHRSPGPANRSRAAHSRCRSTRSPPSSSAARASRGGEGALWRTVVGVLFIALINNAFNLLGVEPSYLSTATGLLIIIAVSANSLIAGQL